ncbi:MAG: hypothetical protein GQ570_08190 [Helicobacteraceae bacterium]|nr:hypothetical protein [Helicobacteraceae bacterium]
MAKVEVQNACRCFLRSGMVETQNFDSSLEAKEEAERMVATMKKDFCKKHDFIIQSLGENFKIMIKPS